MAAEYGENDEAAAATFVRNYDASELAIASEFLTNWLPFLSRGLCSACSSVLRHRVLSLRERHEDPPAPSSIPADAEAPGSSTTAEDPSASILTGVYDDIEPSGWDDDEEPTPASATASMVQSVESPRARMSWADMAQEDELADEEERERALDSSSSAVKGGEEGSQKKMELTREQREMIRFRNVGRKKDFICLERVKGKIVNILDGLELHTGVFSAAEQKRIVDFVYELQEKGRHRQLGDHTYSEPMKWMKGKGRVTLQFGCCYNYAMDKDGNPPGILKTVVADPIPPLFKVIIKRLVRWHVLPTSCIPDSCIVNIYEQGDCIPPHIDSHDFTRPFSTISFLSECSILFGSNLKISGPGEFTGSSAISLPVGSVLVLNGNGADIAKHCVPSVPTKRISITFRKMDETKWPINFTPDADLKNIQPLMDNSNSYQEKNIQHEAESRNIRRGRRSKGRRSGMMPESDFRESQALSNDPGSQAGKSSSQVMDDQSASNSSLERSDSFQKTIALKSHSRSHATNSRQDDVERHVNSSRHDWQHEEESGSIGSSRGEYRRRIRMDQRRILVSHNLEGEETNPRGSGGSPYISRLQVEAGSNGRRRVRLNSSDQ